METTERVRLLVAPLVQEAGAELYDIEFAGGVLRVTVDRDGGVDMGVIGSLTRAISRLIDETDPIPGTFTLEVSSPGLERPLRTPEHFGRAVGEAVTVKTHPGVDGDRRCAGTLVAADEVTITVESDEGEETRRVLRIDDIERARTTFAWGPSAKPGGKVSKPGPKSAKSPKQSGAKQSKAGAKSPKAGAKASKPADATSRSTASPDSGRDPSSKTPDPETSTPKSAPTSKVARP